MCSLNGVNEMILEYLLRVIERCGDKLGKLGWESVLLYLSLSSLDSSTSNNNSTTSLRVTSYIVDKYMERIPKDCI